MSIFSLNWFKSSKKDKLQELQIEEQKLKNELLRKQLGELPIEQQLEKPFSNMKLVNDVLTIILTDGSILSKPGATQQDFIRARGARTEADLFEIVSTPEVAEERKKQEAEARRLQALKEGIQTLRNVDDFEVDGDSVYLKGINRSLPQLLVERFIEIVDEAADNYELDGLAENDEYQGLKRFFMWCCLNPRAEVADKLYDFLQKNSFRITKQGFFVALRNVVTIQGHDTELIQFVSNAYNKVKAVWKKNPDQFRVVQDEDGGYAIQSVTASPDATIVGGLTSLYLDLPNMKENRFTDAHTKTFDIRIGRVVSMPPEQCSWSTADCAEAGLHFTSDEIHYVGCGDTSVLILINPMKVVGIGTSKGRCYEYLPVMTVPREEATTILHDLDFDTLELDEEYAIRELQNLSERAKDGFVTEVKKYEFNIPRMTILEIDNIVASLEEMKSSISSRVTVVE